MSDLTTRIRIGNAIDKKLFEQLKKLSLLYLDTNV